MTFSTLNGGFALNTSVLPVSFRVNQTCVPSGDAAIFGQKGLACGTLPTIVWSATETTTVSGVNDKHT
jgi:hypothetical protein